MDPKVPESRAAAILCCGWGKWLICAPRCSAVQFGVQDKPWTGVAGALVEQKLKVSKTGQACITFHNYFFEFIKLRLTLPTFFFSNCSLQIIK